MMRHAWRVFAILALTSWAIVPVLPQTGSAIVKGTIFDPGSANVPGAKITLENESTGLQRGAESSESGGYYFASVNPGRYRLLVEASGFKRWSGTFVVEVGAQLTVDPHLEIGAVDTIVEVSSVAPSITTESSEIGDVKDALRIQQLPLNGRDITNLFNLTPGVEGGGNPRVNGLKVGSVEMLVDGISVVDRFGGGVSRTRPGLDTVQEFRIETTGSSARYSRPSTVTMVTRSGTNQIHGSLFETHRNNSGGLRARQRQDGNTSAKLIRNEFGIWAGGPILLPKLYDGRNRSFWFLAYEGSRLRQQTFSRDTVATAEMWAGNFNQIIDNAGAQTNIYDPLTTGANGVRQMFPGNIIPASRLHPFYKTMQGVSAVPTNGNNPFRDINFEKFYPNILDTNSLTTRLDHRFSDKDSIYGRFTRSTRYNEQAGGRFGSPAEGQLAFGTGRSDSKSYNTAITWNHIFSPTFLNELLLAANRAPHGNGTLADFEPWADRLGLPNPFGVTGWPTLGASGPFVWDADNRSNQHLTAFVVEDNVTRNLGKHNLTFGVKLRREDNNVQELQQAQGSHTFGADWTALYDPASNQAVSRTGTGLASMALGLPTFLSNQYNRGYFYFQQKEFGLYIHDNWKLSRRLTLDLGVRWDKWTPYHEKLNRLVNVDVDSALTSFEVLTPQDHRMEDLQGVPPSVLSSWAARGLTWRTADQAGYPSSLVAADNNNFGPRLGMAYRLNDKTVLRASYGEFFWTMPLSQILQSSRTNPPLNLRYTNPIGTLDTTSTFAVRTAPRPEFYVGSAQVDTNGVVLLPNTAQTMTAWDGRNWKDGRAQSWHVSFERELPGSIGLRLSYLGDHGRDMEQRYALNPLETEYNYQQRTGQAIPSVTDLRRTNPNWNFRAINRSGFSNTHSAQVEIEKRYSNGLAFQWFYTFTRSLTTSDSDGFSSGNATLANTNGLTEVPTSTQILGAPNLSFEDRLRLVYYNSTAVPPQRIRYNAVYDLPFGKGRKFASGVNTFAQQFIGGWQIATLGEWRGGNWLSVANTGYLFGDPTLNADERLLLNFNNRPQRLWFAGDFDPRLATNVDAQALQALVPVDRSQRVFRPVGANFDNRIPMQLANGTTRNTSIADNFNWNAKAFFLGPGAWNTDFSIFKNFSIRERTNIRFTADFFNVFNHPVDGNPNATTGLQDLSVQTNDPRILQFSLRVSF